MELLSNVKRYPGAEYHLQDVFMTNRKFQKASADTWVATLQDLEEGKSLWRNRSRNLGTLRGYVCIMKLYISWLIMCFKHRCKDCT
jgi:hypothetical protein